MFKLTIRTDNSAFHDDTDIEGSDTGAACVEVARILREIAEELLNDATSGTARDANGNTVGKWELA